MTVPVSRIDEYRSLARALTRGLFIPGGDDQDVEQLALIALWEADKRYDPSRGVPFGAFATEVIRRRLADAIGRCVPKGGGSFSSLPRNVWMGVSVENARHTWRADVLRQVPAAVRFISAEPLLGSLFTEPTRGATRRHADPAGRAEAPAPGQGAASPNGGQGSVEASSARANDGDQGERRNRSSAPLDLSGIDWVIVGGESGPGARPFDLGWAREIIAACRAHGVAPFVKQLGSRPIVSYEIDGHPCSASAFGIRDRKGGDWDEWGAYPDLRVREFPEASHATR